LRESSGLAASANASNDAIDPCLKAAITAPVNQTDAPLRRSKFLSTLSQLKQWKVRISEFDWDELPDISVIGA
jgi:hypothetical protein